MSFNQEEREKMLHLNFYDDYITSDEENDFEEKDLIEEGEVIDPMALQQMEESEEEEEDIAEQKQNEGLDKEPQQADEALESYQEMTYEQKNLLTCDELFGLYLRHTC